MTQATSMAEQSRDIEQHAESTDRLSIFREAVGITDVVPLGPRDKRRNANNIGVFKRVVDAEKNARLQYYSSAFLINACLLLQLVFASALTALGASGSSHVTITIFGAANTVLAGVLSFTKGQGLPNRLRQYQNTLRKVREYIEQRERDFSQLDCTLSLQEEIRAVISMYESARQNDEDNDPSVYQPPPAPTTGSLPTVSNMTEKKPALGANSRFLPAEKPQSHQRDPEHSAREESSREGETRAGPSNYPVDRNDHHDRAILRQVAERMLANNW